MTRYYKAVRPDGTDFWSGTVRWLPPVDGPLPDGGMVVTHPTSRKRTNGGADAYLSVATAPTDCTGMSWPCRLAVVERTRAEAWKPLPDGLPHKVASWRWRVVAEVDAHQVFGPQGVYVAALIERAARLTVDEARRLDVAWSVAWDVAWSVAWDVAWSAAMRAAMAAAWNAAPSAQGAAMAAASDAARGLVVRDLISTEHYDALTLPWRQAIGRIHPDDPEVWPRWTPIRCSTR